MPVLIEGAVDLVAVAAIMLLIGFLIATRYTLTPVVSVLHRALGWVPGLGGLVDRVDNAVLNALDRAIAGSQQLLADLFTGIAWTLDQTGQAIRDLGHHAEGAFDYLTNTTVPAKINSALHSIRTRLNQLDAAIDDAVAGAAAATHSLETRLAQSIAGAAAALQADAVRLVNGLDDRLSGRIGRLEGSVDDKVAAARAYAANVAGQLAGAVDDEVLQLRRATTTAIAETAGDLRGLIGQAAAAAAADARAALGTAEADVAAARAAAAAQTRDALAGALAAVNSAATTASAQSAAALRTAEAELADVAGQLSAESAAAVEAVRQAVAGVAGRVDDVVNIDLGQIRQQLRDFDLPSLPATIAGLAALAGVVTMTAAESGLDTPNCRAKVKGICNVDPHRWEALLLGLAPLGVGLSLRELVEEGGRIAGGLGDLVRTIGEG